MTENNLLYQHANIFYRSTGKGKRVMLLHGFAEDGSIWENQIAFLKNHFRLLIPDIPGSGRSELIPDGDIATYTEVIKAIIADDLQRQGNEGSEEITMIGHSMGGYIALAFAEKYPQQLAAFGLFHSTAFADNEEKKLARAKAILFIKGNDSTARQNGGAEKISKAYFIYHRRKRQCYSIAKQPAAMLSSCTSPYSYFSKISPYGNA